MCILNSFTGEDSILCCNVYYWISLLFFLNFWKWLIHCFTPLVEKKHIWLGVWVIIFWGIQIIKPVLMLLVPGDVARVNGQLAVSRAFGDKNLKTHLRSDPDITEAPIDGYTELLILASDGLWKVPTCFPTFTCPISSFSFWIYNQPPYWVRLGCGCSR